MKDAILQHFGNNWLPFYEGYLGKLKKAGKQYRALCPFHEDHRRDRFWNEPKGYVGEVGECQGHAAIAAAHNG